MPSNKQLEVIRRVANMEQTIIWESGAFTKGIALKFEKQDEPPPYEDQNELVEALLELDGLLSRRRTFLRGEMERIEVLLEALSAFER